MVSELGMVSGGVRGCLVESDGVWWSQSWVLEVSADACLESGLALPIA